MQSRAGVTSESLVYLKEALALVMSEDAGADPYARDQEVTDSVSMTDVGNVPHRNLGFTSESLRVAVGRAIVDFNPRKVF